LRVQIWLSTISARNNGAYSDIHLQPDGGGDVALFNNVANGQIRFTPSGQVGIGTITPSAPLTFADTTGQKINFYGTSYSIGIQSSELRIASNADISFYTDGYSSGEKVRISNAGDLGVGTTAPAVKMHIVDAADTTVLRLQDSDGTCNANPESGSVTWTCSSDIKLKTNIHPLASGLDAMMRLKPSTFTLKTNGEVNVGFIAQDVQEVLPDLVSEVDEEGTLGVAQDGMIPYMVKAIQDLKRENDALKARIEKLEAER
jgi:hypothetical protein